MTLKYQNAESHASISQRETIKALLDEARADREGEVDMAKGITSNFSEFNYSAMFGHSSNCCSPLDGRRRIPCHSTSDARAGARANSHVLWHAEAQVGECNEEPTGGACASEPSICIAGTGMLVVDIYRNMWSKVLVFALMFVLIAVTFAS